MSTDELKAVKKYLKDNLNKNFIQASSALIASSMLFVQKLGEKLRFCMNYRKLNVIIKKNQYLLFFNRRDSYKNDKNEVIHEVRHLISFS